MDHPPNGGSAVSAHACAKMERHRRRARRGPPRGDASDPGSDPRARTDGAAQCTVHGTRRSSNGRDGTSQSSQKGLKKGPKRALSWSLFVETALPQPRRALHRQCRKGGPCFGQRAPGNDQRWTMRTLGAACAVWVSLTELFGNSEALQDAT